MIDQGVFKNRMAELEDLYSHEIGRPTKARILTVLERKHDISTEEFEYACDCIMLEREFFPKKVGVFVKHALRHRRMQRWKPLKEEILEQHERRKRRIRDEGRKMLARGEVDPRLVKMAREGRLLPSVEDVTEEEA